MKKSFGLDFGTSNSALSLSDDDNVRLLDIDVHSPIKNSLKSVLYFMKEGIDRKAYVGYEAVKEYIATGGEGRYLQSIKTFLPDSSFTRTEILNKTYKLEELIAYLLRSMKERGEQTIQSSVEDVVLGRPVLFSEDPRKDKLAENRLVSAARSAGFKNITLQLEPIAAALSFENNLKTSDEKLVLVGDFGGGTSDFTIMKSSRENAKKQDRSSDILAVGGIYIGGDLFDSDIMWEKVCNYYGKTVKVNSLMGNFRFGLSTITLSKLKRWHQIPHLRSLKTMQNIKELKYLASGEDKTRIENLENLIHKNYGYLLFQAIEKAKCELSESMETKIRFNDYGMSINEGLSQKEFEGFIEEKVRQIETKVEEALKDANLGSQDIDVVFLTGGSSYVPLIKSLFEARFGEQKIKQSEAFTSVAYGLGVYSSILRKFHA
ncbi:MAG: Hsp70 family protein [Desulfobacteraceae bacterium]|nr:Hsp70 family protein [Desulfobacteraceae bacterium]MBU4054771.1 Hsp70 family protein [Pseudomonadota bacterium]